MPVNITIVDVRIGWSPDEMTSDKGPSLIRLKNPSPTSYQIGPKNSLKGTVNLAAGRLARTY